MKTLLDRGTLMIANYFTFTIAMKIKVYYVLTSVLYKLFNNVNYKSFSNLNLLKY